ncbi:MAG: hypothetical protein DWQ37_07550 [Planctomycetota bacterium]|nr:MAG: hypothetical protein DWQ37_07550 [Planctomycetota bacterium]
MTLHQQFADSSGTVIVICRHTRDSVVDRARVAIDPRSRELQIVRQRVFEGVHCTAQGIDCQR